MGVVLFCGCGSFFYDDKSQSKQSEALVPYDALKNSHEHDIHDYEIEAIMAKAKSQNLTLILDCDSSAGAILMIQLENILGLSKTLKIYDLGNYF